jgi:hypothetical protein
MLLLYKVRRDRNAINRVKPAAWNKRPIAASHIHLRSVDMLEPRMRVLVCIDEEEAFHFRATTSGK